MAGAQLVGMYAAGMITEGMGLIHPVMSYCGDITISFTSCREMLPDPAFYADCLRESFAELGADRAARAPRRRANRPAPTTPRRRRTSASTTAVSA